MTLRYIGAEKLSKPVIGSVTRVAYPFNEVPELFVDMRDGIFLLGLDFEMLE